MATRRDVSEVLGTEISQAKTSSFLFLGLHVLLVSSTIIVGGATTFMTALKTTEIAWLPPLLAAITTALGMVANQTGFKKKYNGYRLTKTEFQNLQIKLMKESSEDSEVIDSSFLDEILKLRAQKVARTTDAG